MARQLSCGISDGRRLYPQIIQGGEGVHAFGPSRVFNG